MRSILAGAAALSLIASPALAATNPASSLSVAKAARASTPTAKKSELFGGGILAVVIAAGVIAIGVVAIVNDESSDSN
ncbi:hypothetical protein AB5I41_28495 [Sphingomonas sp. MMS24-JH45]